MNSCLIFDLDGTLIDSREDLALSVNLARADFKLPPLPLDTVVSYVGDGARNLMKRALKGSDVDVEKAIPLMKRHYMEHLVDRTSLYPGVAEGLEKLAAAGYKLGLITNKPDKPCIEILRHFDIRRHFSVVVGGDSIFPLKPDPASVFHILKECGCRASGSWIMGDNHTDLESGARAGLKKCYAKYGFGSHGNKHYDMEAASFREFADKMLGL